MTLEDIEKYIPKNSKLKLSDNLAFFEVPASEIIMVANDLYKNKNLPLKMITATDEIKENGCFKVYYIFGIPKENVFLVPFIKLENTEEFPSLATSIHEAWNYERKIKTFFGLTPVGHPDQRLLILQDNWPKNLFPLRKDFDWQKRPEKAKNVYEFQRVEGEGVYEIPVGPIHAGIIEPGHFRFNVVGEEILLLEARLGFTHKGCEKLFETIPLDKKLSLSEKISGDSSFSHSLAFCQAIEYLSDIKIPERAEYLRVIFAELERLANHIGDIGAIMIDTGFNFGGANGSRLREMVMQINERLSGSRFLRGVNAIGGVTKDISKEEQAILLDNLQSIMKDFSEVIEVAEGSSSLLNRLQNTGILSPEIAKDHGVIGVAGKALSREYDARTDHPYAAYDKLDFKVSTNKSGDVYARFYVRIKEVYSSFKLIKEALENIPSDNQIVSPSNNPLKKNSIAISIVEGWRGDIMYFVATDAQGNISRVDVRDPSFLNWAAVGYAGPGNIVPDFPLINKSFNLSYTGNDL